MNLPNNIESEKVVLNKLLTKNNKALESVLDYDQNLFFDPTHKKLFTKIIADIHAGIDFDQLSLHVYLAEDSDYKEAGGQNYLKTLKDDYDYTFQTHFDSVLQTYFLRTRLELHAKSQLAIIENKENLGKLLEQYEYEIYELSQKLNAKKFELESADTMAESVVSDIDRIVNLTTKYLGVPTGFQLLDELTLGMHKSDLTIVAARVSSGKSSYVGSVIDNNIQQISSVIFLFSLEMSKSQLIQRLIASIGCISLQSIRRGNLSDFEWARFLYALDIIKASKLYIDDTPGLTVTQMQSKIKSFVMKGIVPDVVFVDYLQLMKPQRVTDNRAVDVASISGGLKLIAKTFNVPVIALSQFSRSPEKRLDHRPILSDLRDSGMIEADADNVIFLYRDELYAPTVENRGLAEAIIAKQRMGPLATVPLAFIKQYTKFINVN